MRQFLQGILKSFLPTVHIFTKNTIHDHESLLQGENV